MYRKCPISAETQREMCLAVVQDLLANTYRVSETLLEIPREFRLPNWQYTKSSGDAWENAQTVGDPLSPHF
jgi:hypothetical protein